MVSGFPQTSYLSSFHHLPAVDDLVPSEQELSKMSQEQLKSLVGLMFDANTVLDPPGEPVTGTLIKKFKGTPSISSKKGGKSVRVASFFSTSFPGS